jgi:ABC-2 type transport system permease protein
VAAVSCRSSRRPAGRGGFLINVITQGTQAPTCVVNLSPFVHLPAVPNVPPDWPAISALTVVGLVLITVGIAGYSRRDLTT